jgi:hypothetical protein
MSKFEINGLYFWRGRHSHWMPCGLDIVEKLWWRFMPGVVINVAWPRGQIKVGPAHREGWSGIGPEFEYVDSADPNDHYRPWLEKHVGNQGWDWNWGMGGMDATENRLTIKIKQRHQEHAIIAKLMWS